jgi:hypothetical protein
MLSERIHSKMYILYDSIFVKFQNRQSESMLEEVRIMVGRVEGGARYVLGIGMRDLPGVIEMFCVN